MWASRSSAETCPHIQQPIGDAPLLLLAAGESTEAIAEALCISPVAVRNHVQRILTALGVHSRLEAVLLAQETDLI
jgi:two-component system nitrate/nitrite response regulator NarL